MKTITLPVKGLNFAGCAPEIEKRLSKVEHITNVQASYISQTATITYHEDMLNETQLREMVQDCGFLCGEALTIFNMPTKTKDNGHTNTTGPEHAAHTSPAPKMGGHESLDHSAVNHSTMDHTAHTMAAPKEPSIPPTDKQKEMDHSSHTMNATPATELMDHSNHKMNNAMPLEHQGHPMVGEDKAKPMEGHKSHDMSGKGKAKPMDHTSHDMSDPAMAKAMEADMRNRFFVSFLLTIPVILYSTLGTNLLGLHLPTPFNVNPNWVLLVLASPVVWWGGWIFHYGTYRALRNRTLNMNVLVSLGVMAAYLFSVFATIFAPQVETSYDAAAMLVTFVLFGHWMEMRSRLGSSDALNALLKLVPAQANLIETSGNIKTVPVEQLKVSDLLLLRPGEKVPVDGQVTEGESAIDESMVTGESIPLSKKAGDEVIGGTVNGAGSLRFRATKIGSDTALAQIVQLVQTAQNSKAPAQRIADKAAEWLVALAVTVGIVTFLVWFFIIGQTALFALTLAVTAVVITCPDALGLATPTAVAVGTGIGARNGILIKNATALEQTSKIQAIIFDKTGTLTEGKPAVTDIVLFEGNVSLKLDESKLLQLAATTEADSEHPLARTIVEEAKTRHLPLLDYSQFKSIAGGGVQAMVEGQTVLIGTPKLLGDNNIELTSAQLEQLAGLQAQGKTVMVVAVNNQGAGLIAVADRVRPSSKQAIAELQKLDIQVAMLTGDNKLTAEAVGKELGISRIFAEVLPADKARYVKELQAEGLFTAMVGDGVNDAPALAQADLGIAIGAGTGVAIETAEVVLMRSDPLDVLAAIRLSKATVTKMKQNLFWAAIYNVVAIPIAAGVLYPIGILLSPEVGALAMSASSITVATNAVLLKGVEKKLRA